MVGKTLRSYRIQEKIGAGGMGVVYRALDSRLDRTVAIKVLPPAAMSNPDRERRFVQEAKAASALNHPNIVAIYDIDSQNVEGTPVQFIAMEYVAGETLDRVVGRKGMRIRDALKYAIQIADALAAAHAAGIVHRDLKPTNVMVTPQGVVKLLDFGLAKPSEREADPFADTVQAAAAQLTEEGTVLGTVAYMSPEQAEGKKVDARSDIFSFGSVLYEMITGRQAFPGTSKLSAMSAILYKDPQPLAGTVPGLPQELDKIVSRCIKKDPERRWQSMADLKVALEELRDELDSSQVSAMKAPARRRIFPASARLVALGILAGVVLAAIPAILAARHFLHPEPASFQRLTFRRGDIVSARFSPDGNVIYAAEWDGAPATLFSVRPGNRESRPLGLPTGRILAVSQAGEMLLLLGPGVPGTLARAPLGGGTPREILENVSGADWGPDGESMAVVREVDGKQRLEYPLGTVLYETEGRPPVEPAVSPDGQLVAFMEQDNKVGDYALCIAGPGRPKRVLNKGWRGLGGLVWSRRGDEIWFSGGQLNADPGFYAADLSGRLRLVSQAAGWISMRDQAPDGRLLLNSTNSRVGILFLPADGSAPRDLAWMDISMIHDLSDDAKSIVFLELSYGEGRNPAIYLRKTDGSAAVRMGWGNRPALSPDGKWIVSIRQVADRSEVATLPTGPGESRVLAQGMSFETVEWFPDSKHILMVGNRPGEPLRSWRVDAEGGEPQPISPAGVKATRISPDGRSYLIAGGGKLLLGTIAGGEPKLIAALQPGESVVRWSGDGRYIFLKQIEWTTIRITRLTAATGSREPWREVKVPEPGAYFQSRLAMSADGKAIACSFEHDTSNLYLLKGPK